MAYEYKMIQAAPHIIAQRKNIQTAAADYLQELVNEQARLGWEFFRIDDFLPKKRQDVFLAAKRQLRFIKLSPLDAKKMINGLA